MKLLLIEDDAKTAEYIARGLRELGHTCNHLANGLDGLSAALDDEHDAAILDRNLPGLDGLAVLTAMRAQDVRTPVLLLSALGQVDDRVAGLKAGGVFPARDGLQSRDQLLKREGLGQIVVAASTDGSRLQVGDLTLDLLSRTARRSGREIELGNKEFQLLEYLMRHAGQVVTRTMLIEAIWDYNFNPGTNVIDVHISRLRAKIDAEGETGMISTVRGAGYRLDAL